MKNYFKFKRPFRSIYMYIDTENYLADSLFYKRKIPVKFGDEWGKEDEPYIMIFCKVKNKHTKEFEEALSELSNKMSLCGHNDYDEWCQKFILRLESDIQPTTNKEKG